MFNFLIQSYIIIIMLDKVKDSYVDLFRVGGLTLSVFSSEDVI